MPQPQLQYLPTDQSPPIGRLPCFKHRLAGIACLLAVWYASSLLTSMSTKEILRTFPYPITLAAVQQAIAVACGWLSLRREKTGKTRCELLADRHLHLSTLPIASVMVCSLATYRWALMSASVSFVHTIKTLGPAFTIAFSRLLLNERLPAAHYLSVAPVILGVALTSITEAEFAMTGFLAVLMSTAAQALQSVGSKRLMREREVGKSELFAMAALHALLMLLPLSLLLDSWRIHRSPLSAADATRVIRWLLLNGLCSYINQYSGLSVLEAMSSPLSHAIANVMKRTRKHARRKYTRRKHARRKHARRAGSRQGCGMAYGDGVSRRHVAMELATAASHCHLRPPTQHALLHTHLPLARSLPPSLPSPQARRSSLSL